MRPDRDDWAKISVQMTGRGARKPVFQGIVRIDGVQSLDLVSGMPSVFRVEPGEHVVSVRFRRRFRVAGFAGKAECRLAIALLPREEVRLHCGIRTGAHEERHRAKHAALVESVTLRASYLPETVLAVAGFLLLLATATATHPLIYNLSLEASRFLGLQGPWESIFVAICGSRLALTCWMALATSILVSGLIRFRHPDRAQLSSSRIEHPYFLEREDSKCQKTCLRKVETELSV
jgi:hypothetical protein